MESYGLLLILRVFFLFFGLSEWMSECSAFARHRVILATGSPLWHQQLRRRAVHALGFGSSSDLNGGFPIIGTLV